MNKFFYLLFLSAVTSIGTAQIATEDLLLHYKFDNNTLDETTNNFHGIPNGVTYTEDRHGVANGAVYFDGINDFISLPNLSALKPNLPVTFSFWIKYDSSDHNDRAVFNTSFENDRSSGIYFNTQISTGKYAVNFGDGSDFYNSSARRTYVTDEVITNNVWHHVVAVVRSATDMKIHVDCKNEGGSYSGSGGPLVYSITAGNLGRNDRDLGVPPLYFKGAIDDFRYYNRALVLNDVDDLCTEVLDISDNVVINTIKVYPNPAQTELNFVTTQDRINTITFYNALGKTILTVPFNSKIDISNLSNGLYFVQFTGDSIIENRKIIIKK